LSRRRRLSSRLRDYEFDLPPSLIPAGLIGLIEAANSDPRSIKDALESPEASEWSKAMDVEFRQLAKNKTWKLVDRVPGVPVLSNRWVLLKKRNERGEVVRYKARLTIRGFVQRHGVNYFETYAAVVRTESR
jgi:hypothetical protein